MHEQFDRSYSGEPPHVRRVPGTKSSGKFLDDEVLESLLQRLDEVSSDAAYPLQLSFYEKLLQCDLLLPVPVGTQVKKGLPLITLENARDEVGLPVFTNETTLSLWEKDPTEYVIVPFDKLCGYALQAKVDFMIVNVAGPNGCEISLRDFSFLAEKLMPPPVVSPKSSPDTSPDGRKQAQPESTLPVTLSPGTPTRLGAGKAWPEGLNSRIKHVLSSHTHMVERAYQFEIAFNEGPLQPALGIALYPAQRENWEESLWPNLQAVLHEMLERGSIINVFLLNEAPNLAEKIRIFYKPMFIGDEADKQK